MHLDIISMMIKWITCAIQLFVCASLVPFFPIGVIQHGCGPNFTQFLPSTQSNGQLRKKRKQTKGGALYLIFLSQSQS